MSIYDVSVNGRVVQSFEANDFYGKNDEFIFVDEDNGSVGSIVKSAGMSVKKVEKSGYGKQDGTPSHVAPRSGSSSWMV